MFRPLICFFQKLRIFKDSPRRNREIAQPTPSSCTGWGGPRPHRASNSRRLDEPSPMSRSSRPGLLAYVQKHPYYTLEHLAFISIAGLYFFSSHLACSSRSERLLADGGTLPKRPVQRGQCEEGDTYCCCPAGKLSALFAQSSGDFIDHMYLYEQKCNPKLDAS